MTKLLTELEKAEAHVAAIKRQIASSSCREVGHRWEFIGGCSASCEHTDADCQCTTSVNQCKACGDCDYGDNEERGEVIARCKEYGHGN